MKNNKHIRKCIVTILMLFISIGTVFAQADKKYGTRISDTKTGATLKENVILELDSKDKGFMLPRLNTVQRDRLVKDIKGDTGLAIYNTDIDCVEFWSKRTEKWMSVCGSLPPATLDLVSGSCTKITFSNITHNGVSNTWQQGTAMPENGVMLIEVKVEAIGTYSISATTDNGYFFSAEGQFQSVGQYTIPLKVMGTPTNGYDQSVGSAKTGDNFKFTFNGKESIGCPNVKLNIVPADLEFTIKPAPSNTYKAEGEYIVKKEAKLIDGHKINVKINVTSPGTAVVTATSNTDLGMKFSGSVKADIANIDYDVVLEPVSGENIPKVNVATSYDLTFSTNTKNQTTSVNSQKANIVIKETTVAPFGSKATFGTVKYYTGETLTAGHTITLPINVKAAGTTNLRLKDAAGKYEFEALNVVLDNPVNATDEQMVTFKAKSLVALPTTTGALDLNLSADQTRFITEGTDRVVKVPIEIKPVAYTIQCNSFATNRPTIPWNQDLDPDTFFITVRVDVTVAGEYEIKLNNKVDGLEFSSNVNGVKQKFASAGPNQLVRLNVVSSGGTKPKAPTKGPVNVQLVSNDANTAAPCANIYTVKVGYRDLKVLVILASSESTASRTFPYLNGGNRFGETGKILVTGKFNVTELRLTAGSDYPKWNDPAYIAKMKPYATDIANGVYDLIVTDRVYSFTDGFTNDMADALYKFITEKNGAAIICIDSPVSGSDTWHDAFSNWRHTGNSYVKDMLKKFNNNTLPVSAPLSYPSKGYVAANSKYTAATKDYPYTAGRTIEWRQGSSGLYGMKTQGTNFLPMLVYGSATTDAATAVYHKDYPLILMMVLEQTNDRDLLSETRHVDGNNDILPLSLNSRGDTGNFVGNVFVNMITELMNK